MLYIALARQAQLGQLANLPNCQLPICQLAQLANWPNRLQYIGSTWETGILIILVHSVVTCKQHTTLHCIGLQYIIICGASLINLLASAKYWHLEIYFCEIHRQYIRTGCTYIYLYEIYWQCIRTGCTHSADEFLKVSSTIEPPKGTKDKAKWTQQLL